jgi:hypothetical protein
MIVSWVITPCWIKHFSTVSEEYVASIFRISNLVLMKAEVMGRVQKCPLYRTGARPVANPGFGKGRGNIPLYQATGN